jgi:hypothetical protein
LHVVEVNRELTVLGQVEVLLGDPRNEILHS